MIPAAWLSTVKYLLLLGFVVALVHKGMLIERHRWQRAVERKNVEIAAVNEEWTEKLNQSEIARATALATAKASMAAAFLGGEACSLPVDLVVKANGIR